MTLFALRRAKAKRIEASGSGNGSQVVVSLLQRIRDVFWEITAGDVLASLTTSIWNPTFKARTGGAPTAGASLNWRQTTRIGAGLALAPVGILGFNGQIELETLRAFGPPEAAPEVLYACTTVPFGTR